MTAQLVPPATNGIRWEALWERISLFEAGPKTNMLEVGPGHRKFWCELFDAEALLGVCAESFIHFFEKLVFGRIVEKTHEKKAAREKLTDVCINIITKFQHWPCISTASPVAGSAPNTLQKFLARVKGLLWLVGPSPNLSNSSSSDVPALKTASGILCNLVRNKDWLEALVNGADMTCVSSKMKCGPPCKTLKASSIPMTTSNRTKLSKKR